MPQLTLETTSGTVLDSYSPCANTSVDTGGQLNQDIANSNYPQGAPTPPIRVPDESADLEPRFRQRVRRA